MAARTQMTADLLRQFENKMGEQVQRFDSIERNMNNLLNGGFLWDDLPAQRFRAKYAEGMQPLRSKLFPAMQAYQQFLYESVKKAEEYTQD
jgi:hypothetical protein